MRQLLTVTGDPATKKMVVKELRKAIIPTLVWSGLAFLIPRVLAAGAVHQLNKEYPRHS